jgi:hypothetical protein
LDPAPDGGDPGKSAALERAGSDELDLDEAARGQEADRAGSAEYERAVQDSEVQPDARQAARPSKAFVPAAAAADHQDAADRQFAVPVAAACRPAIADGLRAGAGLPAKEQDAEFRAETEEPYGFRRRDDSRVRMVMTDAEPDLGLAWVKRSVHRAPASPDGTVAVLEAEEHQDRQVAERAAKARTAAGWAAEGQPERLDLQVSELQGSEMPLSEREGLVRRDARWADAAAQMLAEDAKATAGRAAQPLSALPIPPQETRQQAPPR